MWDFSSRVVNSYYCRFQAPVLARGPEEVGVCEALRLYVSVGCKP